MAQYPEPVFQAMMGPVVIVGPQFLAQYPVDLTIVRKVMSLSDGNFAVTDVSGNLMFKIKGKLISLHDRRILLDVADYPILSFQKKLLSAHRRWQVFRGDSSDPKDLLFSAKQSSIFQFKTSLDIFLAANKKEDVCDFKVKGSWLERSCTIFVGESTNIIAQILTAHNRWNAFKGKSSDLKDLMFTVKESSIIQLFGTDLEVFLASNSSKEQDFRIKGSSSEESCIIFAGKSDSIIAQMRMQHDIKSMAFGTDKFAVTVYPNVDVAFVVALIVILEEINIDRSG